jgi:hypothetical protein
MKYLNLSFALLLFAGCGPAKTEKIVKSDYTSYRDYWYDKTLQDVGATVAKPIESVFDFNVLPPNVEQSHKFKIRNIGDKPLHLLVGPKTCKCTAIKILDRIIKPNATGEVQLSWTTVEFAKEFSHSGSVYTNDPNQPKIKFHIKGKVAREFGLSPNKIDFQRIIPDSDMVEDEIFLFSGEWSNFKITNIASTFGENLSTELTAARPAQLKANNATSGYNLRVKLKPPTQPGWFNGKLTLTVDGGDSRFDHTIDVCGKVVRRISLTATNEISLTEDGIARIGRVESQVGKTVDFLLTVNDPHKQIVIRKATMEPSFIQYKLAPLNKNVDKHGVYKLQIKIPVGAAPALFDRTGSFGSVHLEFDHPRVHSLDFDLDFFIID